VIYYRTDAKLTCKSKPAFCLPALIPLIAECSITEYVPEADLLTNVFEIQHVTINGYADGMVTAHVSGGTKPYLYSWSNGCTDSINHNLSAGKYFISVTDLIDQVLTDSATIIEPDLLEILLIAHDATGPDQADGSVDLEITGGVAPYRVLWSNGDTTEDLEGILPGEYRVKVVDAHLAECFDTVMIGAGENAVIDIDGNVYAMVEIGEQVWLRENLKVTHDPDGNPIITYSYNDNPENTATCGRLYTWDVAMNGSVEEGAQGLCPNGWHVPSDVEWIDLEVCLGMDRAVAEQVNVWRGTDEGAQLRPGGGSGYDIRYCGRRSSQGSYSLLGLYEYVWTSTEFGDDAWRRCMQTSVNTIGRWNTFPKTYAFSVRCIKDQEE
jgi:uncharacterized protein (TIGR02145 family)